MFVQSKAVINPRHKNGLALEQRRGGSETLIQWCNGDQQWCHTIDLDYQGNAISVIGGQEYQDQQ